MKQNKNTLAKVERHLKVYPKYFERVNSRCPAIFPEIRLCGKWLKSIGFKHGQTIKVSQQQNKITITVEDGN